tara:strand:- start:257 stop:799 length:543 start_codon:yes stop_codon:yes gene_type:complete
MTNTAALYDDGPTAIRYPRGTGTGVLIPEQPENLRIGKARIVSKGEYLAIVSIGTMLATCEEVIAILAKKGANCTLVDARFAKPIDTEILDELSKTHAALLIVEEGTAGGFAAHVMQYIVNSGHLDTPFKVRAVTLPDTLIDHAERDIQLESAGLDVAGILEKAESLISDKINVPASVHP